MRNLEFVTAAHAVGCSDWRIMVWYALIPGLAITLVVVGMNFFADGLQDVLDPRHTMSRKA